MTAARVSRRESARLIEDVCGLKITAASVEGLAKQASDALEDPYAQILAHVDRSPVRGADETSWRQGGKAAWLSVATAADAALFQLGARRDRDAAKALLGEDPQGVIVTDRYAVYLYIDDTHRQLCHAHLLRDFTALAERPGRGGRRSLPLERRQTIEVRQLLGRVGSQPQPAQVLSAVSADEVPSIVGTFSPESTPTLPIGQPRRVQLRRRSRTRAIDVPGFVAHLEASEDIDALGSVRRAGFVAWAVTRGWTVGVVVADVTAGTAFADTTASAGAS